MPKPKAIVDPQKCSPASCDSGVCAALAYCNRKVLIQEAAYEIPFVNQTMCNGCLKCLLVCPARAIIKS